MFAGVVIIPADLRVSVRGDYQNTGLLIDNPVSAGHVDFFEFYGKLLHLEAHC
jgi:hypothetical protein